MRCCSAASSSCSASCSTPVGWKPVAKPARSSASHCRRASRLPARDRRESTLSSMDTCGCMAAARCADVPRAGPSFASMSVMRQPRAARRSATEQPASPAPRTIAWRSDQTGASTGPRRVFQCVGNCATVISRLVPKPGALRASKPASCRPRRTKPAAVYVASVAPARATRASCLNTRGCQRSGFLAGEKPSR